MTCIDAQNVWVVPEGSPGFCRPRVRAGPPAPGSAPRRYEVAELLDLQSIREAARRQR